MTPHANGLGIEVLRLRPGEDLRDVLALVLKPARGDGCEAASVVSAVGSLSRAVLRYAAEPDGTVIEGPLELISLSGTLSPNGVHLHASVADASGRMRGGHVMPGCIVRTTAELVVAMLPGWAFRRAHDPETGYLELQAKRLDEPGTRS
ncbi:MAG: DNA-binding protein [Comamonadaceae bacterium]|nr:MAG: DNA-binding protein [Comamonadaceae bacterium]